MAKKILNQYDFTKLELLNVRIQNLSAAPAAPTAGLIYFDTALSQFGVYNGASWVYMSPGITNAVTKTVAATTGSVLQVSGGADKTLVDFTSAGGLVKVSATGVVSVAIPGTDYLTATSTNTLTNKTFDAAGVGNTLSNVTTANFAVNVIDTDTTLAANSDTRIASQKATKAYIDAVRSSEMTFIGGIDASTSPNFPAASIGDVYRITVAGRVGGASGPLVTVGDTLIAATNTAAGTQATVGANWTIIQSNVDAATTTTQGLVILATQAEADAKIDASKVLTPFSVANFTTKKVFTIGDGTTTAIVLTHNLNTQDILVSIREISTNAFVETDVTATSVNTATITFAVAPATSSYRVVIIG